MAVSHPLVYEDLCKWVDGRPLQSSEYVNSLYYLPQVLIEHRATDWVSFDQRQVGVSYKNQKPLFKNKKTKLF